MSAEPFRGANIMGNDPGIPHIFLGKKGFSTTNEPEEPSIFNPKEQTWINQLKKWLVIAIVGFFAGYIALILIRNLLG